MPTLPVELIEEIIDVVAQCSPESLANCVLISWHWNPRSTYHLNRIFRTPTVSTFDALHTFLGIVQKHPRLAALATSLEVLPVPDVKLASASYIPFLHLASHMLPNVRRLILGETLHWSDYPLLYRTGTVGFSFHRVISLDLSCHFDSTSDLFYAIQSFRNVEHVRLIYDHPPQWMFSDRTRGNAVQQRRRFSRETFKIQNLELSLAIMAPVLDICGDLVVSLSVVCPEMSTVSADVCQTFASSLALLQTVKITVPVDSNDPMDHVGLGKLRNLLLAPITKPDIRYSLFLVRCREHSAVGYCVEDVSVIQLRWIIQTSEGMDQLEDCPDCRTKSDAAAPVPVDTRGASSMFKSTSQNTSSGSLSSGYAYWRVQFNNYVRRNGLQGYIYWGAPQQTGPRHAPTWTISVFFNQTEYGRGSACKVQDAKETAAEQALRSLWVQRGV